MMNQRLKNLIDAWRRREDETMEGLAEMLGCTRATVYRWVSGHEIPEKKLAKLADILGTTPSDIRYQSLGKGQSLPILEQTIEAVLETYLPKGTDVHTISDLILLYFNHFQATGEVNTDIIRKAKG